MVTRKKQPPETYRVQTGKGGIDIIKNIALIWPHKSRYMNMSYAVKLIEY